VTKLLQTLMDGAAVGSLYALIALGYTMVYGILKFINFAHSDVFMLGAWFSFAICVAMGFTGADAPWYAAPFVLFGSMALCAAIGFSIERLAYRPLRSSPRINVLITAIGVSLLLENVGQFDPPSPPPHPVGIVQNFNSLVYKGIHGLREGISLPMVEGPVPIRVPFGARPVSMPLLISSVPLAEIPSREPPDPVTGQPVPGVKILPVDVFVITVAFGLMGALQWLVYSTKLGRAMRAVSYDTRVASLMGIDVDRVISITFIIGSALAAAAGFLYGQKLQSLKQPAESVWVLLGLKAFVAAVVGGIGNVRGAMAGGLMIGLVEQLGAAYLSTNLRDLYVFTLLIVVLLVRPEGLLGKSTVEKV
jgi:branched-chain amino acid transport system permease protein